MNYLKVQNERQYCAIVAPHLTMDAYQPYLKCIKNIMSRSQWLRGLRGRFSGRSPAEIVGSNPTGDMDVCLLLVLCVVT